MKWVIFFAWAGLSCVFLILTGCGGGGEDEAPTVAQEQVKYPTPKDPDPCTTTYPCQAK